jgi:hypothetical protein
LRNFLPADRPDHKRQEQDCIQMLEQPDNRELRMHARNIGARFGVKKYSVVIHPDGIAGDKQEKEAQRSFRQPKSARAR